MRDTERDLEYLFILCLDLEFDRRLDDRDRDRDLERDLVIFLGLFFSDTDLDLDLDLFVEAVFTTMLLLETRVLDSDLWRMGEVLEVVFFSLFSISITLDECLRARLDGGVVAFRLVLEFAGDTDKRLSVSSSASSSSSPFKRSKVPLLLFLL